MLTHLLLTAAFVVLAADNDTTLRAYAGPSSAWILKELNGVPFTPRTTLSFPQAGAVAGQGPCNTYRAALTVPYPWFETGPIVSTRKACPDLDQERAFFSALEEATLSEVTENTLTLSTEDKILMVFIPAD